MSSRDPKHEREEAEKKRQRDQQREKIQQVLGRHAASRRVDIGSDSENEDDSPAVSPRSRVRGQSSHGQGRAHEPGQAAAPVLPSKDRAKSQHAQSPRGQAQAAIPAQPARAKSPPVSPRHEHSMEKPASRGNLPAYKMDYNPNHVVIENHGKEKVTHSMPAVEKVYEGLTSKWYELEKAFKKVYGPMGLKPIGKEPTLLDNVRGEFDKLSAICDNVRRNSSGKTDELFKDATNKFYEQVDLFQKIYQKAAQSHAKIKTALADLDKEKRQQQRPK